MLKVMLRGYPCNLFCTVNRFRKGHEDPAAWLVPGALKLLDDPNKNPDMIVAETVTSWANVSKVPGACVPQIESNDHSMQIVHILTSDYGTPNVRRQVLIFWEPKEWTHD